MRTLMVILSVGCLVDSAPAGSVQFFIDDEAGWQSAVAASGYINDPFSTGEGALLLAEGVSSVPDDTDVGPTLTWLGSSTGFGFDMTLQTLQPGAEWVSDDTEAGSYFAVPNGSTLSVGNANEFEDDDWRIDFDGENGVFGFRLHLVENEREPGEFLQVFDQGGNLIGSLDDSTLPNAALSFVGIFADVPIGRVEFNEHAGSDDVALWDIGFAEASGATGLWLTDWIERNGRQYRVTTPLSWDAAESLAVSVGGHLVTVDDVEENQWLSATFEPLVSLTNNSFWIGLVQAVGSPEPDGGWSWASGDAVLYTNWAAGSPNNNTVLGDENRGRVFALPGGDPLQDPPGQWDDLRGSSSLPGIVERGCPGDVNGDGATTVLDFNILAAWFGQSVPPGPTGDLNGDGVVTVADFNILAGDLGCGT